MSVMFVTRGFQEQTTYRITKKLTQAKNLMNVMFVTRGFPHRSVY